MRCNCTFCRKARLWMVFVPETAFRLLQGGEALTDYQHTPPTLSKPFLHLTFCSRCGVRPFSRGGPFAPMGGPFYAVNVACLDSVADEELAQAPISFPDGRNDAWDKAAAFTYL